MSQPTNRVTRENCNGQPTYCDIELMQEQNKKSVEEEFDFVKLYRRRENCVNL